MTQIRIDPAGATYVLLTMLIAKLFTSEPRMVSMRASTAAWLVAILGGLLAIGGFSLIGALLARFPGKSITAISEEVLGRGLGLAAGLGYTSYFIFVAGMMFREFSASFRIAVLPNTPISATTLLFLMVIFFAATKGYEGIARMAAYLVPVMLAVWGVTMLGTLGFLKPYYMSPWFGYGLSNTLLLSVPGASLYSEVLALGVMASALKHRQLMQAGYRALLGATVIMGASFVALQAAFPFPALSRLAFPMLDLTRLIEVSEFLQRLEALFVLLWVFVAGFTISMLIVSAATILQELSRLPDFRPLLPAVCLICYTLSFVPGNVVQLAQVVSDTTRMWSWPLTFGLPAVTLAAATWFGKRGGSHEGAATPPA